MKKLSLFLLAFLTFGMPRVAEAQVTVAPFLTSNPQFLDGSGSPLNSGCVFTYAAGTTTPLVTYSDSAGSTPNSNPVILNSGGFPQSGGIWLTAAAYKFVVKTTGGSNCSTGSTITTTDGITWSTPLSTFNGITSTGNAVIQPATAATGGANQSSPTFCIQGFYFSVFSLTDQWCLSNVLGTGTSPTSTFTVVHSGSGGAAAIVFPGNVSVGGTLGAAKCSAIDGVVCADGQTGADMGAKVNAAFAACTTTPCTVFIGVPGSYTYTTDIFFSAPATLQCADGVILNYTGTGKAVKMGPDGLTVGTYSNQPYTVRGCQFTGGANMTHGIYHNKFVVKSFVIDTKFINFGNSTAYNIFFQSQNWVSTVSGVYMWSDATGPCFNGIGNNGYDADNTTSDFGASFIRIISTHIQSLKGGNCTTNAILLDSFSPKLKHVDIAGNFTNLIRVRRWATLTDIDDVYMEQTNATAGTCGILYGDLAGDPGSAVGQFIEGLIVRNGYINVHNTDAIATTAHYICPANASSGLQNSNVVRNRIAQLTAGQPIVVLNNTASQVGNFAQENRISIAGVPFLSPFGSLHTSGGSVSNWDGPDEIKGSFYNYKAFTDISNYERGGCTWSGSNFVCGPEAAGTGAFQTFVLRGTNVDVATGASPGTSRWEFGFGGNFYALTDNSFDIGNSATTLRPRNIFVGTSVNVNNGTTVLSNAGVNSDHYLTTTNCASSGGTCAAAPAGRVSIAAAASTVTVATTVVTANSEIFIQEDATLGTALSVTCNTTTGRLYTVTTRTAGTSFVITASAAPAANPACLSYHIIN